MTYIATSKSDGVNTIILNRPEKRNALTFDMYSDMAEVLAQASWDNSVRVVVIKGNTEAFTAGNDIGDFLAGGLRHCPPDSPQPVYKFLNELVVFPKPIVAGVCGPAVGIGTTMLLHCDLVIAGSNAKFSTPFVNLGLCTEAGSSLLLPLVLGPKRAAQAALLGEPFDATLALQAGLVNRVVAPAEMDQAVQETSRALAAKPLRSLLEIKRLLRKAVVADVQQRMEEESLIFAQLLGEPAAREAASAFLEKRRPDFSRV